MLKFITTAKWSFKLPKKKLLSSSLLLPATFVQKNNSTYKKYVIWSYNQGMSSVLLNSLFNSILYKKFYKRVFGLGNNIYEDIQADGSRVIKRDKLVNFKNNTKQLSAINVSPERINTNEAYHSPNNKNPYPAFDAKNPFLATVTDKRELHKGGERSCLHIELDIAGSNMQYEAGDHVAILPPNNKDLVERLAKLCEANLGSVYPLLNNDTDGATNYSRYNQTTYRHMLTHFLEITALPSNQTLSRLAECCTDKKDKNFLRNIASITPKGKEVYKSWIQESNRNIVHILEDIKSCKPSIDLVCELLPRLQPRFYSISSSSKLYPTKVHITAVLVQYQTPTGRINKGVATSFLRKILNSSDQVKVPVFVNKSEFRLPTNSEIPIVMVALGTGLAPFRGFIQERQFLRDKGKVVGETILYFGCRKKCEDFIYNEELEEFERKGTLTLKTAFSRDQKEKIYVTHLLAADANLLWKVLGENNGHFYICGAAKEMAEDIRNILIKTISTKGKMSETDAINYLRQMETHKRYYSDAWR